MNVRKTGAGPETHFQPAKAPGFLCTSILLLIAFSTLSGAALASQPIIFTERNSAGGGSIDRGEQITFTVEWWDPAALDTIMLYICEDYTPANPSGCNYGEVCSYGWTTYYPVECSADTGTMSDGVHGYYAYVCDSGTCSSSSNYDQFTVVSPTNQPPSISSHYAYPGTINAGDPVSLNAYWSDPEGDSAQAYFCKTPNFWGSWCADGEYCSTGTSTYGGSCTYYSQTSESGTQDYYLFVCDSNGNCNSGYGSFYINSYSNSAPTITSYYADPDSVDAGDSLYLNAYWYDPEGDQVKAFFCRDSSFSYPNCYGGGEYCSIDWNTYGGGSCSYTTQAYESGTRYYYLFVCDNNGNCNSGSDSFTVNTPNSPPEIDNVWISPASPVPFGTNTQLSAFWTDPDYDMARAIFCNSASTSGNPDDTAYCVNGEKCRTAMTNLQGGFCNYPAMTSGTNYAYAFPCDEHGACGYYYEITFYVSSSTDTTPPIISSPLPSGPILSTTSTTISVQTNENAWCKYSTNNEIYDSMPNTFAIGQGTLAHSQSMAVSPGSSYTFYVRCMDSSNNKNPSSTTISFSVAAAAPSCTDLEMNQDETDIDCGGTTCPACSDGKTCAIDSDCSSGYCSDTIPKKCWTPHTVPSSPPPGNIKLIVYTWFTGSHADLYFGVDGPPSATPVPMASEGAAGCESAIVCPWTYTILVPSGSTVNYYIVFGPGILGDPDDIRFPTSGTSSFTVTAAAVGAAPGFTLTFAAAVTLVAFIAFFSAYRMLRRGTARKGDGGGQVAPAKNKVPKRKKKH